MELPNLPKKGKEDFVLENTRRKLPDYPKAKEYFSKEVSKEKEKPTKAS